MAARNPITALRRQKVSLVRSLVVAAYFCWASHQRFISIINIVLIIVLAIPAMLSENLLADPISAIFGKTMIDCEDFLVTNLALPIGSLFYVLFCTTKYGWGWDKFFEEMNAGKGLKLPKWMKPYMSYVLPVIILVVLVLSVI